MSLRLRQPKPESFIFIGLERSGKTRFIRTLMNEPCEVLMPTIGCAEEHFKYMNIPVTLVDMSGQMYFRRMLDEYYRDVSGFVFVMDSSDESRYEENRRLLVELRRKVKDVQRPVMVVANKSDLRTGRWSYEDASEYVDRKLEVSLMLQRVRHVLVTCNAFDEAAVHRCFKTFLKLVVEQ